MTFSTQSPDGRLRHDRTSNIPAGTELFGKIKIERRLGAGNMGTVYECSFIDNPNERVALKVLRGHSIDNERATSRFRNELQASYRVSHSGVVRGSEFFRNDNMLAFTMEYIDGESLAMKLAQLKRFRWEDAVEILLQLCESVQAIHSAGIIHRDLKPQNILVSRDLTFKITDFSAAKFRNPPPGYRTDEIIGTPSYMSPESLRGEEVDEKTDLYSLGVIGYQLICGHTPFEGAGGDEEIRIKMRWRPALLHEQIPSCPRQVSQVIHRAIEIEPWDRFASVAEFQEALKLARAGEYKPKGSTHTREFLRSLLPTTSTGVGLFLGIFVILPILILLSSMFFPTMYGAIERNNPTYFQEPIEVRIDENVIKPPPATSSEPLPTK